MGFTHLGAGSSHKAIYGTRPRTCSFPCPRLKYEIISKLEEQRSTRRHSRTWPNWKCCQIVPAALAVVSKISLSNWENHSFCKRRRKVSLWPPYNSFEHQKLLSRSRFAKLSLSPSSKLSLSPSSNQFVGAGSSHKAIYGTRQGTCPFPCPRLKYEIIF